MAKITEMPDPKTLYIAFTFDAEADSFDSSFRSSSAKSGLQFSGIEKGIPLIRECLDGAVDSFKNPSRSTWFVRIDHQIKAIFGDAGFLLDKYHDLWRDLLRTGNEIGFHPHLYKRENDSWIQETNDTELELQLTMSYQRMTQKGFRAITSRIGEAFCSNSVMNTLQNLGIRCDSTAMPGRIRTDEERMLDWGASPEYPFHPDRNDYRTEGPDSLALLEVPMTMISAQAEYDPIPVCRYVDLSFHHHSVKQGLEEKLNDADVLVTVTHPSSVLPEIAPGRHGLLSFCISEFEKNMQFILSTCEKLGRPFQFVTLTQYREIFTKNKFP